MIQAIDKVLIPSLGGGGGGSRAPTNRRPSTFSRPRTSSKQPYGAKAAVSSDTSAVEEVVPVTVQAVEEAVPIEVHAALAVDDVAAGH